jgi:PAS domain S-box-containing protein
MLSPRHVSLHRRLKSALVRASLVSLLVVGVAALALEWVALRERAASDLSTRAALLGASARGAIERQDTTAINAVLDAVTSSADIEAAAVFAADGTVLAQFSRLAGNPAAAAVTGPSSDGQRFEGTRLEMTQPVSLTGGAVGHVFLRRDLRADYGRFVALAGIFAIGAFVAVGIATWLAAALTRTIGDPVRLVTKAAESVAENKDLELRVPQIASYELGSLIDSFNTMLAALALHASRAGAAENASSAPAATSSSAGSSRAATGAIDPTEAPWPTRMLEGAPEFIALVDADGQIDFLNRSARERLGFKRAKDATAATLNELVAESQRAELVDVVLPTAERTGEWRGELNWRTRGGRDVKLATRIVAHRDAAGAAEFFSITAHDALSDERAPEEVLQSEERLRQALDAAQMGTWEWDAVANEVIWDETTLRLFGRSAETFAGTHEAFLACVHPDERANVETALLRAFAEAGAFHAEFSVPLEGGAQRWIAALGRVQNDADGRPARMAGVFYEIGSRG